MLNFIAFLQPIIALMFIIAGAVILLMTWISWVCAGRTPFESWIAYALNHGTAIALVLTGFYIAHW